MNEFRLKQKTSLTKRIIMAVFTPKLRIIVFSLVIVMGLAYIVIINNVATGGFALDDLRDRVAELDRENRQLELSVADLQSLANVEKSVDKLKLVQTKSVEYLETGGVVAVQP